MKILILSLEFPFPPDNGGARLKLFHMIKGLSELGNTIDLISFINPNERQYLKELDSYCRKVTVIDFQPSNNPTNKAFGFFSSYPPQAEQYNSPEYTNAINQLYSDNHYDIIHFDQCFMSQYHTLVPQSCPTVIAPNDSMVATTESYLPLAKTIRRKLLLRNHLRQARNYERFHYSKFDACVVVSEKDKTAIGSHCLSAAPHVIPNGVDLKYFSPRSSYKDIGPLVFTGTMNFAPNVDAMLYFTKSIWPLIKELVPKARMQIVGRSPSPEIHSLQSINGIEIVGEVPDIRPYIKSASVFVCPMRLGSGIKNKLLEAMSSGLPIVSSSSGFSGIEAKDGDNILVADDPSKFAEKVSYLLHDSLLREKLGSGARALIEREYSWSRAAKKYAALYESLVAKQTLKIKNESP